MFCCLCVWVYVVSLIWRLFAVYCLVKLVLDLGSVVFYCWLCSLFIVLFGVVSFAFVLLVPWWVWCGILIMLLLVL